MSKKIKLDPKNFNLHTVSGMELLENSVKDVGVIESIAVDAEGEIITGNARFETFEKLGLTPKIVELADNEYPVIQTKLEGEKRVKAALYANTVSQKNINLDYDLIQEIAVEEFGIDVEEVGVELIDTLNIDSFFDQSENPETKNEKNVLCPHCGKDINKNASDYENDGNH